MKKKIDKKILSTFSSISSSLRPCSSSTSSNSRHFTSNFLFLSCSRIPRLGSLFAWASNLLQTQGYSLNNAILSRRKRNKPDVILRLELLLRPSLADVSSVALDIAIGATASDSGQANAIIHLWRSLSETEKNVLLHLQPITNIRDVNVILLFPTEMLMSKTFDGRDRVRRDEALYAWTRKDDLKHQRQSEQFKSDYGNTTLDIKERFVTSQRGGLITNTSFPLLP